MPRLWDWAVSHLGQQEVTHCWTYHTAARYGGAAIRKRHTGLIKRIQDLAASKHATDVVVLDMRETSLLSEYAVLCNGQTARQVKAIADAVWEGLEEDGCQVSHVEGYRDSTWILLDCGEVLIHIFHPTQREFYALDRLWGDAPRVGNMS